MKRCAGGGEEKVNVPQILDNRPGLKALRYRVGTHASFFEAMKRQLATSRYPVLQELTARDSQDLSLALLDAWAVIGDVLTFYQERIANEGFLRTSTEHGSIVELARLVGYRLRPGVASSVYVAYLLEPDSETVIPAGSRIQSVPAAEELPQTFETSTKLFARAAWNKMKPRHTCPSLLSPETSILYVKGTNHNLVPNAPLVMQLSVNEGEGSTIPLVKRIEKIETDFPLNRTKLVLQETLSDDRTFRSSSSMIPSIHTIATQLSKAPSKHPPNALRLPRHAKNVYSPNSEIVSRLLEDFHPRIRFSLSQALSHAAVHQEKPSQVWAFRAKSAPFGHNAPFRPVTDLLTGRMIGSEEWALEGNVVYAIELTPILKSESSDDVGNHSVEPLTPDIASMKAEVSLGIGTQRLRHSFLLKHMEGSESPFTLSFSVGDTRVTVMLSMGDQESTLRFSFDRPAKTISYIWEQGEQALRIRVDEEPEIHLTNEQSIHTRLGPRNEQEVSLAYGRGPSQNFRLAVEVVEPHPPTPNQLFLDVEKDEIVPESRVLVERPGKDSVFAKVQKVRAVSKNDYGLSGRVTQLTLDEDWLESEDLFLSVARDVTVYAQSEILELADEPLEEPIRGARITLDGYYPELEPGRWLIIEGLRVDISNTTNIPGEELAMLSAVEHDIERLQPKQAESGTSARAGSGNNGPEGSECLPGDSLHTTLILSQPLAYSYQRESVHIYGNVVHATHGETRAQVLGSADASRGFQRFTLQQAPLTFVSAPSEEGVESSLQVRVNNVQWDEVNNLVHQGSEDRVFMVQRNAEGYPTIVFGNGIHGLRPTTGIENVSASFRIGIGKGGNVAPKQISVALDRPLGVREVINPLPATGGANSEGLENARKNVPRGLKTLGRVVSLADYENFACSFAGVGKAKAASMSDGNREMVHLTITGVEDAPIDDQSDVFQNLLFALARFGDAHQIVQLGVRERLLVVLKAQVRLKAAYLWEDVAPQLRATLLNALSFENRDLGEPLYLSQVYYLLQGHVGIQHVQVEIFDVLTQDFTEESLARLWQSMKPQQVIPVCQAHPTAQGSIIRPAQIAYMSSSVTDTLILNVMD